MELVVKFHLSDAVVSKDLMLRTVCVEKILNNVNIIYLWNKLCPESGNVSNLLLEKVVKLFLNVRGHAFAKAFKTKLHVTKSSASKAKSLRKTLKKKSTNRK
jgi:hypothetical protein